MSKLTKLQKIQLCSSVIPYFSTFFVAITTMTELKRKRVSWIGWVCYSFIIVIAMLLYTAVEAVLSYEEFPVVNTVVAAILFAIANTALVFLQVYSQKLGTKIMPRKYVIIANIGILVFAFVVVGWVLIRNQITAPSHIEDINGSDNRLAVITMEEIYATRNAGTATMGGEGGHGDKSMVDGDYAIYDYDSFSLKWKKMSGIFTLQATKVETDTLTLSVDSLLTSGNAEILIFIDSQYYKHVQIGQDQQIILENISGKTVVVKLAAESAEIELTVNREY